jgi:hypothetical protein
MVFGVVFLLIGIMGFIPPLLTHRGHGTHGVQVRAFEGYLLGLFHVNVLHSLVHVLFGVMGIAMSRSADTASAYARIVAVSYALLTIMGLIPNLNTLFGLLPIRSGTSSSNCLGKTAACRRRKWPAQPPKPS